jgi:predicted aldo/keto reductase-like oxidoreductase
MPWTTASAVLDHFVLSFAEEFIPVAKAKGVAVAGMKVIGLGVLAHLYEKAMRYAFGLPIDTAVIGMDNIEQLKNNLAVAEKYKPLTDEERLELFKEVLPLVSPKNAPWKAENWTNLVMWKKR